MRPEIPVFITSFKPCQQQLQQGASCKMNCPPMNSVELLELNSTKWGYAYECLNQQRKGWHTCLHQETARSWKSVQVQYRFKTCVTLKKSLSKYQWRSHCFFLTPCGKTNNTAGTDKNGGGGHPGHWGVGVLIRSIGSSFSFRRAYIQRC